MAAALRATIREAASHAKYIIYLGDLGQVLEADAPLLGDNAILRFGFGGENPLQLLGHCADVLKAKGFGSHLFLRPHVEFIKADDWPPAR